MNLNKRQKFIRTKDVVLESDCLQIFATSSSYLGRLADERWTFLASLRDQNILFGFIKHSANS